MGKKNLGTLVAAFLMAACSHSGTVSSIATDYNRGMATTRDEQLLINVLRASGREPLMFSAVGEVSGSTQDKLSLSTEATNLIADGINAISPTLGLEGSSGPTVKVTPLSSKEFTAGILKPMKPETLNYFMSQGWDAEFLLPLVLASYQCSGGPRKSLNGADASKVARWGAKFSLKEVPGSISPQDVTLSVSDAEALEMLRTGVAGGYKLKEVKEGTPASMATVVLSPPPADKNWTGIFRDEEAGEKSLREAAGEEELPCLAEKAYPLNAETSSLQLRSVEGIIYYLGESFRPCLLRQEADCSIAYRKSVKAACSVTGDLPAAGEADKGPVQETRYLFRLRSAGIPSPTAAIRTRHNGNSYWVDRLDRCDTDRTLKTLSFLSQLIALQTEASDLSVTPSVIAVGTR